MRTKLLYVLVSSKDDIYLEQAYVSMYSAKFYMPDCHIVLLTDNISNETFTSLRKNELKYIDELIVIPMNQKLTAQQRSRQLKTSARNLVKGDFLFIDCDTIIVKPLDEIDECKNILTACRDSHSDFSKNPYRKMCLNHGHLLGWPIETETTYFNSGVLFVKDTFETKEFYTRWNKNLNAGYKKKIYMDQPSFAKTNYDMNHIVSSLPDVWNCQLKHGVRYLKDAKIIHYLCTNPSQTSNKQFFLLNEKSVFQSVKESAEIPESIKAVIRDPFVGISEVSHCFAGEDIYFFTTSTYKYIRNFFSKKFFPIMDFKYRILNYIKNHLIFIIKKLS